MVQTAPTLATGANGVTVIALLTTDGGTKWRGWVEATIPGGAFGSLYTWGEGFLVLLVKIVKSILLLRFKLAH